MKLSGWDEIISGLIRALQLIFAMDPGVVEITALSLRVSGTATVLAAAIGIPLGAAISLKQFRGKTLLVSVIDALTGLPPVVVGLFLYLVLSSSGPMGFLRLLYTPEAMILAQLIIAIPVITSITVSSVSGVDPDVRDAITSLGASPAHELMLVLNEARLGLVTSLVVGFGSAISEVGAIMIVGGNLLGYTRALTTAIVLMTNRGEFAEAIALGIVLLGLAFAVNILLTAIKRRLSKEQRVGAKV